jgi:hypothetical protein
MMVIETIFELGQIVYLKTDRNQFERIVTGISIRRGGVSYALTCGIQESWHYDFEMVTEKNVLIAIT